MISSIPKWVGDLFANSLHPNSKAIEISYITPEIKKIRFKGDIAKMSFEIGLANAIRVSETEFRNYTVAYYDKKNGIFDILFHIHGNGIGSQYINAVKRDDELYISIPRGRKIYNSNIKQQFFFGDETSFGVAYALLHFFKKNNHQFQFYFELNEINKGVPEQLGLENVSIYPKKGLFKDEEWLSNLPPLKTEEWNEANFILLGNAKSVQIFRKILKNKTRGNIESQGYWLEGKKGL